VSSAPAGQAWLALTLLRLTLLRLLEAGAGEGGMMGCALLLLPWLGAVAFMASTTAFTCSAGLCPALLLAAPLWLLLLALSAAAASRLASAPCWLLLAE
jgi:hypothetical protein